MRLFELKQNLFEFARGRFMPAVDFTGYDLDDIDQPHKEDNPVVQLIKKEWFNCVLDEGKCNTKQIVSVVLNSLEYDKMENGEDAQEKTFHDKDDQAAHQEKVMGELTRLFDELKDPQVAQDLANQCEDEALEQLRQDFKGDDFQKLAEKFKQNGFTALQNIIQQLYNDFVPHFERYEAAQQKAKEQEFKDKVQQVKA